MTSGWPLSSFLSFFFRLSNTSAPVTTAREEDEFLSLSARQAVAVALAHWCAVTTSKDHHWWQAMTSLDEACQHASHLDVRLYLYQLPCAVAIDLYQEYLEVYGAADTP